MKSYVLSMVDGEITEYYAASDTEAERIAIERLGGTVVAADQWDADGLNDDGEPCKRLLLWADDESAEDDSGVVAIAQIETIGVA